MLRYRLVFGALLIAAMIAGAVLDQWIDGLAAPGWFARWTADATWPPGVVVTPIVAALCVVAARELSGLLKAKGVHTARRVNATLAVAGLMVAAFVPSAWSGVGGAALVNAAVGLVLAGSLAYYARHQRVEGMLAAAGGSLLAFCYLGLLMGFVVLIRRQYPVWVLVWALLVIKSCDIGAYFTGRAIGQRKLIVWLSPGKTWEGLFGGLVFACAVGAGGAWVLAGAGVTPAPGVLAGAGAGVVFGVVGQAGDLLMSLLKRDAGVKDSGASLPGFGGVLDVIDSPALVMPVAFWWLGWACGGG